MNPNRFSRRGFLRSSAGVVAAAPFLGSAVARAAGSNELLQVAAVGVGGKGRSDLANVAGAQNVRIVALCDVDSKFLGEAAEKFPKAKTFRDYRRMLDSMAGDIDAVICATPDHMHGSIALAAMDLGKHVYCEKPLAHNLLECRAMQKAAAKSKVVTQMGTQIHSFQEYQTAVAAVRAGVIGKVREVHLWVGRTWDGLKAGQPAHTDPVPDSLDWDLWLGVAANRPYVEKIYHTMEWRRWKDFGTGSLGDMGCHLFDPVFSALELGPPLKVVSLGPQHHAETYAIDSDVRYEFAGTKYTAGPITARWTDGTGQSKPDVNRALLPEGVELPEAGSFMVGDKGVMVLPHVGMPRFYSNGEPMEISIEVPAKDHYHEWADACRGVGKASTPFSYSCPVTESVLCGTIAGRFRGRDLQWNSAQLAFDDDSATQLVRRKYREGWEIAGI